MAGVKGKVAIVTGGARGLGAATCRMLVREGATVVCADVRDDQARVLGEELKGNGGMLIPMRLDLLADASVDEVCSATEKTCGSLDILVNNAAVDFTKPIDELAVEEWDRELGVNLRGPFLMAKRAYSTMKQQGHGAIVNICSTASKRAWPNASPYHASKWGLLGFSHALHAEGRPHNVKVTALVAGGMRTPFLLERFPDIDVTTLQDPANVANAVRFVLDQPDDAVIPELTVIPMKETSWP